MRGGQSAGSLTGRVAAPLPALSPRRRETAPWLAVQGAPGSRSSSRPVPPRPVHVGRERWPVCVPVACKRVDPPGRTAEAGWRGVQGMPRTCPSLPLPAPLGRPGPRILDASVRRYVRVPVARKRVAPPRKKSGSVWRAVRGCQEPALSLPRPASHPRPQCMGVSRIRAPGACKRTGSPRSRSGEQRTARPAGGNGGQSARLIQVALISVYLSKACRDLSRPLPDCL